MASSYSELKCSLSSVPATALNVSSRQILGRLDIHMPLRSPKGYARDSRGLAEQMGFLCHEVKPFEGSSAKIFETWETRPGSTLDKLIGYLEEMDRYDVIKDLIPTLEKDVEKDVEKYKKSLVEVGEENDVAEYQETPVQVDEENDVAEYQETPVQVGEENDVAEYQETPIQVDEENDVAGYQENPVQVAEENDVAEYQETPIQVDEENDVAEYQENPVQVDEENDVAEYLETPIQVDEENDGANNQENPVQVDEVSSGLRNRALTRDDLRDGVCTQYDALLAHDEDDSMEAFEIAQNLESPKVGLKLLIPARDLLAGNFEFQTLLELMMNRCRHIVMILTPNFVRNRTLEFQVNFAVKLGVERNERILIPVIVKPCGIPPVLRNMTPINLTKKYSQRWLWENLVNSILPEGSVPFSLPPLERCPLNIMNAIPNQVSTVPEDVD